MAWKLRALKNSWPILQIRACVLLALAACASAGYAGYPFGYSVAAPAYASYHAPLASVSTVHHAPAFGYGLGYGLGHGFPGYGFGLGSYGLSYGYGLGGIGYAGLLRKKCKYGFLVTNFKNLNLFGILGFI
ncbi:hypothetical protein V5799_000349 [Amblyomma americanum]|uniref:Uncharacterized protein n=1 Tax=Amblyomma americanum TaxID=6943 RepID=A0AAQ4D3B0_AMBAM